MEYNQIVQGSSFGGRILPPFEVYMNLRRIYLGLSYLDRPKIAANHASENEEKY